MSNLTISRAEKDEFFAHHPQSPLDHEQKEIFDGLSYFPQNAALRFELDIDEFDQKEAIEIQTSTGDVQHYTRYGKIHFDVEGESTSLTVFESGHGFFVPFVDSQAGKETYGAGRYLDPHVLPNGKLLVDFNQAYNPYCSYNDRWSCPLTPWENRLKVPIRAGEKSFKKYD
ncbi:MAG: DUF1684 domain-containing protein [Anaerolineales bacterium]|nr:DUF1684 domain-containing protein [Chloroflexota bacterium]MBL6979807.1 DUF1684 domain-containing protein [Anaerolineales bacterium]